jgi:hypothetical protein
VFLWVLTTVSLLVAIVSWRAARRATKRLEEISHTYWELKYEQGELRLQIERLKGVTPGIAAPEAPAPTAVREGFVSLSSLKR